MKRTILALSLIALLGGCSSIIPIPDPEPPKVIKNENKEFNLLPPPAGGPVIAAVYSFTDKTGQRKPSDKLANISFAVTQGAEVWVIKALQEVGNGKWFKVVERVGLDNLTKERQIIRQARDSVGDQRQLRPMMFAGILVEGGIIGYDSNTLTGGAGARYLGIGPSTQYRQDVVTVNIRAVSVQTGEVLLSVSTTKTIISTGTSLTFFRFFDMGTQSLEAEMGHTINEPVNYAVRAAIEQAIVELVKEGDRKGFWKFKNLNDPEPQPVKQEEVKKDELVSKNPAPENTVKTTPPSPKPDVAEVSGGNSSASREPPTSTDTQVPPKQTKKGIVLDYSNIRKGKDFGSEKILNLKPETSVNVVSEDKTHYFVEVDGKEGWIAKKFIKVQK